jgi:DNA-binding XRE family transcriptional regulator
LGGILGCRYLPEIAGVYVDYPLSPAGRRFILGLAPDARILALEVRRLTLTRLAWRTTLPFEGLGMTIARIRKRRKMTQAQLAKRAGVHRVYVAQIEGQTKIPSLATLEKLAKALNVKVGRLLE